MSISNAAFKNNTDEWYTPEYIIREVKYVLSYISLDPASNEYANQTVNAHSYFTKEDNALGMQWITHKVFCNPPYGKGNAKKFTEKMYYEYTEGNFREGILLIGSAIHTKWFTKYWGYPICLYTGKIKFYNQYGKVGSNSHDSMFVYFGKNKERFYNVFSRLGYTIIP